MDSREQWQALGSEFHWYVMKNPRGKLLCAAVIYEKPDNEWGLSFLAVTEKQRNQGLGHQMVEYLQALARERQVSGMRLMVTKTGDVNRRLAGFYGSFGFYPTSVVDTMMDDVLEWSPDAGPLQRWQEVRMMHWSNPSYPG